MANVTSEDVDGYLLRRNNARLKQHQQTDNTTKSPAKHSPLNRNRLLPVSKKRVGLQRFVYSKEQELKRTDSGRTTQVRQNRLDVRCLLVNFLASSQVYVHSKIMIIDDRTTLTSSYSYIEIFGNICL